MTETSPRGLRVGDWVRFMRDNRFVIGRIEYFEETVTGSCDILTDAGVVNERYVLEVRRDSMDFRLTSDD